jgi:hypothetical protein
MGLIFLSNLLFFGGLNFCVFDDCTLEGVSGALGGCGGTIGFSGGLGDIAGVNFGGSAIDGVDFDGVDSAGGAIGVTINVGCALCVGNITSGNNLNFLLYFGLGGGVNFGVFDAVLSTPGG